MSAPASRWRQEARLAIFKVDQTLPHDITLDERKKAIDAAYPFGPRKYHPYKMWLIERREYLAKHGHTPKGVKIHESPLERLMRRGGAV